MPSTPKTPSLLETLTNTVDYFVNITPSLDSSAWVVLTNNTQSLLHLLKTRSECCTRYSAASIDTTPETLALYLRAVELTERAVSMLFNHGIKVNRQAFYAIAPVED